MGSSRVLANSARCINCQNRVLRSFITSLAPVASSQQRPISRAQRFLTTARPHRSAPLPTQSDDAARDGVRETASTVPQHAPDATADKSTTPSLTSDQDSPWYLTVPEATALSKPTPSNPLLERQRIPPLPSSPPPILSPLLQRLSVDIGLDHLTLLDLRSLDPPPALGANLFMIFGTARSEKHLNVSADRLCRWLRSEYKLRPFADGLLGRNELKLKLRRKDRRLKMMGAAGGLMGGEVRDDGIGTGWVCVNAGTVPGGSLAVDEGGEEAEDTVVGFGTRRDSSRIVVQILTEEKRGEIDLETLWTQALEREARRKRREADAALAEAGTEVEVDPDQSGKVFGAREEDGLYLPEESRKNSADAWA